MAVKVSVVSMCAQCGKIALAKYMLLALLTRYMLGKERNGTACLKGPKTWLCLRQIVQLLPLSTASVIGYKVTNWA